MEVVGAHHAHARDLFDVAMAVDAARQHPAPRGVDVARAGRELRRDFHDHAVAHADVGVEGAVCIADPAVAGREAEGGGGDGGAGRKPIGGGGGGGGSSGGRRVSGGAARISGASQPISSTARSWRASGAASGAKSCPLPWPPTMTTRRRPAPGPPCAPSPSMAATVAPTLVPLLSSKNSTPSMQATDSTRCGSPR